MSQLRLAVPARSLAKLEQYRQQAEIRLAIENGNLDELEECPFCDFKAIVPVPANEDREFRCQNENCGIVSCRLCNLETHVPLSCEEKAKDKGINARHAVEEAMTEALVRTCNKCKNKFVKDVGCNKMTCPTCGTHMCYVCKQTVTNYNHFSDSAHPSPAAANKCPLNDDVEARHDADVKKAEEEAMKKVREENPDVSEEELKLQVSEAVKEAEQARRNRNNGHRVYGHHPGAVLFGHHPGDFVNIPPPMPPYRNPRLDHEERRRREFNMMNAIIQRQRELGMGPQQPMMPNPPPGWYGGHPAGHLHGIGPQPLQPQPLHPHAQARLNRQQAAQEELARRHAFFANDVQDMPWRPGPGHANAGPMADDHQAYDPPQQGQVHQHGFVNRRNRAIVDEADHDPILPLINNLDNTAEQRHPHDNQHEELRRMQPRQPQPPLVRPEDLQAANNLGEDEKADYMEALTRAWEAFYRVQDYPRSRQHEEAVFNLRRLSAFVNHARNRGVRAAIPHQQGPAPPAGIRNNIGAFVHPDEAFQVQMGPGGIAPAPFEDLHFNAPGPARNATHPQVMNRNDRPPGSDQMLVNNPAQALHGLLLEDPVDDAFNLGNLDDFHANPGWFDANGRYRR